MLTQIYFNWEGTLDEFEKVKKIVKEIIYKNKNVDLVGLYVPSNEWNYSIIYEVASLEKFVEYQREVRTTLKNENLDKISARKLDLLFLEKELY